jgi:hypothetical protein
MCKNSQHLIVKKVNNLKSSAGFLAQPVLRLGDYEINNFLGKMMDLGRGPDYKKTEQHKLFFGTGFYEKTN